MFLKNYRIKKQLYLKERKTFSLKIINPIPRVNGITQS